MVLSGTKRPLELRTIEVPKPAPGQILLRVEACAVCRTDLHIVDGELGTVSFRAAQTARNPPPEARLAGRGSLAVFAARDDTVAKLPLIPGHQIVGRTEEGQRLGVPWLGWTCGRCRFCTTNRENLCDTARFTGYTIDGGYAEYALADQRFCFPIPDVYSSEEAAPLLCAGLVGFRAYRMVDDARRIGFYGFGSSAQILAQIARADGREVYAFTRKGDTVAQVFAREMGAVWAGGSDESPVLLDAAIIFAPAGELVVTALRNVIKGGSVVCAGIHMTDIPSFPYDLLWGERSIRSVANLTRDDGREFFERTKSLRITTKRTNYPLEQANLALDDLRSGRLTGTAVLKVAS